jgi:hypothetical protein
MRTSAVTGRARGGASLSRRRHAEAVRARPAAGRVSRSLIEVYGGGVFILFATRRRHETYGAGRYLIDTIKGADLGGTGVASSSFNYAYHRPARTTRSGAARSRRRELAHRQIPAGEFAPADD